MRAGQTTRSGGLEVLDVVDLPDLVPGDGRQLSAVAASGVAHADTHTVRTATDLSAQAPGREVRLP